MVLVTHDADWAAGTSGNAIALAWLSELKTWAAEEDLDRACEE